MAMAVTAGSTQIVDLAPFYLVSFQLTASGNYTTGGDSLATAFTGMAFKSSVKPVMIVAQGIAGYKYEYDYTNDKMLTRECAAAGNPLAEIPGAPTAYPAGVTGDTISCVGIFLKK
jgi:hypothetical protein